MIEAMPVQITKTANGYLVRPDYNRDSDLPVSPMFSYSQDVFVFEAIAKLSAWLEEHFEGSE